MASPNTKMRGSPLQTPGNVRIVVLIHVGDITVSFEKWQLAPTNAVDGKFYIPESDPKFVGNPFEAESLMSIQRLLFRFSHGLSSSISGSLWKRMWRALFLQATPHTQRQPGLSLGRSPSAPRRNSHATLPATRPRCKSPQYHDRHIRSYDPSPGPGPEQQRQFWTLRTLKSKPLSGSRGQRQGQPEKEALLIHGFTHRICQLQHLSTLQRGFMHIHLEVPQLHTEVATPDLLPHQAMQR
ncbi:hypothetical protein N7519_006704 [Penicillium mononematosum]|uniref:uncharacterized protein n=1 Tax=Penicillium mononematosum TaxID=268346 RepID=UPI0025466F98|nr:uncharacterized protein N7519_006704 [Penicillium mononematosum]KAJ6185403.1 hypothetical protein N7519_006704 [Penicillium mononematosum]